MHIERITVGLLATQCYALWRENRDDCVVIDPGAGAEKIRRAIGDRRIAAVLLTHGHFDHMGAADRLLSGGGDLYIHEEDVPALDDPRLNVSWMVMMQLHVQHPAKTVREGDVISAAGMDFTVLHTPGHTRGSVCYAIGGALFTGDTAFHGGGCGRTDLPGDSDADMHASLAQLAPLMANHEIYPGH